MAERGNSDNVDYCVTDFARESKANKGDSSEDVENVYEAFTDENGPNQLIFNFGKGVGRSKGKK